MTRGALRAALVIVFSILAGIFAATSGSAEMRRETLDIVTSKGTHTFSIEIADTPEEKAKGLMFRRTLPADAGMLFPYLPAQEATMWMRNTYISLDMVFIRADGVVHRIERGTEPFSERTVTSQGPVTAVLELIAGTAERIGLMAGDKVRHSLFGTGAGTK